jgi:hypothetical protein
MSTLSNILTRLFTVFAKVPIPGTITAIGGDRALYPTVIANEGLGGHHVYDTLEELATVPISRLQKGMAATVNQHTLPDGNVFKKTIFYLENLPPMSYDYIKDIPGYDISQYWKVDLVSPDYEAALETQYSPNCDLITGAATIDGSGGQPPFPGSNKGKKITKSDYNSLHLSSGMVTLSDGSQILGYWANEYDSTLNHVWMRSRLGSTSDWSIPVKIDGEGYESGDYIENRFKWSVTQPLTPPMQLNGRLNNEPEGWTDVPGVTVSGSKLWMIKGQKNVYQQLKSPWLPPIEIKLDPSLTRYSERAIPNPNDIPYSDLEINGWEVMLDSNRHRFMANRMNVDSSWIVTQIGGESGEYTDYIFKAFKSSLLDVILDNPNAYRPTNTTPAGWSDTPPKPEVDETVFVSVGKKFYNGELKNSPGWSDPIPFSGQDSVIDIIKSSGGDEFKKDKTGVVTPSSITLTAYMYKGVEEVTPTSIKWTKIYNAGLLIDDDNDPATENTPLSEVKTITILPDDVYGKAIYKCVQVYDGKEYVQEYSILDIADGYDANSLVLTANAQILTKKADGSISPSTLTLRALSSNLSDEGQFTWYKRHNPTDAWIQIMDGASVYTGDTYSISYSDFATDDEVHYKVQSVDLDNGSPMYDEYTIYSINEATGGVAPATLMILSNESHTLVKDEGTGTTNYTGASTAIKIYSGTTDETGLWSFTKVDTNVTSNLNMSVTTKPILTVTNMTGDAGYVTINASKDGQTISKQFSLNRIKDPVGAIILDIDSSVGGFTFSPTQQNTKTLTANLYVDGVQVNLNNPPLPITYQWSFDSVNKGTGKTQSISASDVEFSTTVKCVVTYNSRTVARIVNVTDVKDAKGLGILYSSQDVELTPSHKPDSTVDYNATNTFKVYGGITAIWTNNASSAVWMVTKKQGVGEQWSNPIRIKGEKGTQGSKGNYIKNIFIRSSSQPATPTGNPIPSGWFDVPPSTGSGKLWVSYGEVDSSNKLIGSWSVPTQIEGKDGLNGADGIDGARGPQGVPGRSITIFVQSTTPTNNVEMGDVWISR